MIFLKEKKWVYSRVLSGVLGHTTEFFHREGFTQLMPVILSPVTDPLGPDPGSSVIKTGEVEYLGQRLSLTQSMILHKQMALLEGLEKLFIISPNVRLEHPARRETGRHLFEFSQVDFELARAKSEDVFGLMEKYLAEMVKFVSGTYSEELSFFGRTLPVISAPFRIFTTHELKERFGPDWEGKASLKATQPFWVTDHSREFYDREDPAHPGHYLNYDLIYPEGFGEALSGGEREFEWTSIQRRMSRDRLEMPAYAPYVSLAEKGLIPSAGGGFGVERLVRYLTGAVHVGDVQLFRRVPGETVVV
ncbi:MAG: asparagine synthetase [Candidatus Diapherotrites archaeon]|nr:asparagine synthetase [Candidatus Diapherotrites archaeon]